MQTKFSFFGAVLVTGLLAGGCAGPEQKLNRGFNNTMEVVRWGEMRRSVEQGALFGSRAGNPVTGFNRSLARTGLGLWEVITFPIPNHSHADYGPVWTSYLKPKPVYPDSYKPGLPDDPLLATDTRIGFSGGEVAPIVPGSRFKVFDD